MNMEDLRKISFEFRRVSSDMLNSITDDNNVYLIKFREFIDDNKIIKDYIDSKVKYSSIDWQKSFIEEDCGYKSVVIPKNKNDHIKAMYDYLVVMTDRNKSLNGEAFNFHLGRCKVNERIQFYLNRVFLPLIHYINDYLIEEMIALQEAKGGISHEISCTNRQLHNKRKNLKGEGGASSYIEDEDKKFLLDTGASGLFMENAKI